MLRPMDTSAHLPHPVAEPLRHGRPFLLACQFDHVPLKRHAVNRPSVATLWGSIGGYGGSRSSRVPSRLG